MRRRSEKKIIKGQDGVGPLIGGSLPKLSDITSNSFGAGKNIGSPLTENDLDLSNRPSEWNSKKGTSLSPDALGSITAGLNSISSGINSFAKPDHQYTSGQQSIRGGIQQLAGLDPTGIAGTVVAGLNMADSIFQAAGVGPSNVDMGAAKRAGVKGAAAANQAINSVPGLGILGLTMGKVAKANEATQLTKDYANSFGSSMKDNDAAQKLSGTRMWNAKKASRFVDEWNAQNRLITAIGAQSELAKNNNAWQIYDQQNATKYSGYNNNLFLSKKGMKFPELTEARLLLSSFKSKELPKFENGGKLEKNVIPEGALHKNKHHIDDPSLDGKITEKGIPVIGENQDGEIQQFAEIEKEEIVFQKSVTEQLEDYYNQYKDSDDDNIAIECGKFLVDQILKNTKDNTGLIKNIK